MSQRRSSILLRVMSPTTTNRRFSVLPVTSKDSDISNLSFKHWHKRMQQDHEMQSGTVAFGLWKWCRTGCIPCRKFDAIDYDKKICKCCLKFRTFKALGTILLIAVFFYIFMYSIFNDELLPGGTIFFIFLMCVTAYLVGHFLMYAGLPPMIGHLLVGLLFGNLPEGWLPAHDVHLLFNIAKIVEKILLVIALIRAGLLLDLARIKNRVTFILRVSLFPLLGEFFFIWIVSHLLLHLPWDWSALQGSVLCIVSLASVTSVMEKNRQNGYGEDKHLSTVLIASSSLCVIFGTFLFLICSSYVCPSEDFNPAQNDQWKLVMYLLKQIGLGLVTGTVAGLLIAFFPDKRNSEAAALRILLIGIGTFAVGNIFNVFDMLGAGVMSCIIMCVIASNMWEELGWHQDTNPVQYFYTVAYYFGQPAVLSLVGYTMDFGKSNAKEIGLSVAVIIIGLIGRESICFVTTLGKLYPTTIKEKIFICIAWFSKGTFQALLVFAAEYMVVENKAFFDKETLETLLDYSRCIKQTTILAILLTTPTACYGLTLLTPVLLTKKQPPDTQPIHPAPPIPPASPDQAPPPQESATETMEKESVSQPEPSVPRLQLRKKQPPQETATETREKESVPQPEPSVPRLQPRKKQPER